MDIQHIYEFVELANRLNITETARSLNMTQPTLSKRIDQLEKTLHVKLFHRSTKGLRITREGLALLNDAYALIDASNRFYAKAESLQTHPLPHLSIAGLTNEEAITRFLGEAVSSLSEKFGPSFLEIKSSHHQTPYDLVKSKAVDLAFDFVDESDFKDDKNIEVISIERIYWVALVSIQHPLASRDSISIADLEGQTLLKMEGTHLASTWGLIEQRIRSHGITPILRRQYSMKLIDLITASANLGNGVLILGANFAQRVVPSAGSFVKALPIVDEDAYLPVSGIFRMDNNNPVLDELLAFVAAETTKSENSAELP